MKAALLSVGDVRGLGASLYGLVNSASFTNSLVHDGKYGAAALSVAELAFTAVLLFLSAGGGVSKIVGWVLPVAKWVVSWATVYLYAYSTWEPPPPPPKTPAEISNERILQTFGNDIPASRKSPCAAEVVHYQNAQEFKERYEKLHGKSDKDASTIKGEYLFDTREIYINTDADNSGTITHEQMHFYSSDAFMLDFADAKYGKITEGVNEYFTRKIVGKREGIYEAETEEATMLAERVGEDVLRKAYFGGDAAAIESVNAAWAQMQV